MFRATHQIGAAATLIYDVISISRMFETPQWKNDPFGVAKGFSPIKTASSRNASNAFSWMILFKEFLAEYRAFQGGF